MSTSSNNLGIKPRILFVTRRFPPATGGMEQYAYDLHKSLFAHSDIKLIKWGRQSNLWLFLVLPYFFIRSILVLSFGKVDIIHMQDGVLSVMGVLLKKIFNKPLCVVIHGLDVTYESNLYQKVVPWALKQADYVFCISNATRNEVMKRGVDNNKAVVIPLGITDDLHQSSKTKSRQYIFNKLSISNPDTKILLSVGRLVKRKGVDWFILNVVTELLANHSDLLLVVAGEGKSRPLIEKAISDKGLEKSVKLLGRVSDEDLKMIYNASDIFVMPNVRVKGDMEGFGRVLLEASLCELPVVASGIEGIKDAIVDNKNGILVESKNSKAYVDAVGKLLGSPKYAKTFGRNSRSFTLDTYGWDNISGQFMKYYQHLINSKKD